MICDGGMASLVAVGLLESRDRVVIWIPPAGSACLDAEGVVVGPAHTDAAERFAELFALEQADRLDAPHAERGAAHTPTSFTLWHACKHALRSGCTTIVWPVLVGPLPDRLYACRETAHLTARLAWLSDPLRSGDATPEAAPQILTPLADLSPKQVAELALDLDLPTDAVWWSRSANRVAGSPAEVEQARAIWEPALREAQRACGFDVEIIIPPQQEPPAKRHSRG